MDNSDEPEDFPDGKFVFQKRKDGTFNKSDMYTLREDVIVSPFKCVGQQGEFKLTSTVAKWIAKSCRPINIVEDEGFTEVLRASKHLKDAQ